MCAHRPSSLSPPPHLGTACRGSGRGRPRRHAVVAGPARHRRRPRRGSRTGRRLPVHRPAAVRRHLARPDDHACREAVDLRSDLHGEPEPAADDLEEPDDLAATPAAEALLPLQPVAEVQRGDGAQARLGRDHPVPGEDGADEPVGAVPVADPGSLRARVLRRGQAHAAAPLVHRPRPRHASRWGSTRRRRSH